MRLSTRHQGAQHQKCAHAEGVYRLYLSKFKVKTEGVENHRERKQRKTNRKSK